MSKRNEKYEACLAQLEAKMDKREEFYLMLEKMVLKTGDVPERYNGDWKVWTEVEQRRPWRTQPFVVWRVKRAAKLMSRK